MQLYPSSTNNRRQCGNGSSAIARGKAAATRAFRAGLDMDDAAFTLLGNAANKGIVKQQQQKLAEGFRARAEELQKSPIDKRLRTANQKLASQPSPASQPEPRRNSAFAEIDPAGIEADPKRFQYKIAGEFTKSGSVGSLKGVQTWDPNLAGVVQVWKDPADGKTYVVNGHNRLAKAKELGVDNIAVRYLDAPSAKEARAIGALTNIAEGRGTAMDAAKFFKDSGISAKDLKEKGVPLGEKVAQDGMNISKLDDTLFRKTIDGDLTVERASIIGGSGLDHAGQRAVVQLIESRQKRSRPVTNETVRELTEMARSAPSRTETTMTLFGEDTKTQSLALEKAQLQAQVRQRINSERKVFSTVARKSNADRLEQGGNVISIDRSKAIAEQRQRNLNAFDTLKNVSGPVGRILNEGAERIANGENRAKVEKEIYDRLQQELTAEAS